MYASLAKLVGQKVKSGDALDSNDLLDAWLGKSQKGRDIMLEEAYTFGLRMNDWKYIAPVENTPPDWLKNKDIESGLKNEAQLYNLKTDVVESKNVAQENPGVLKEMEKTLEEIKNQ